MPDPERPDLQPMGNWPPENWSIRKALEEARRFFSQPSPDDPSKTLGERLAEGLEGIREPNYRSDLQRPEKTNADSEGRGGGMQDAIESLIKKYLPEIVAFVSLEAFAVPFFHAGAEPW